MKLDTLNTLPEAEAREVFTRCCGATAWVNHMVAKRPYRDAVDLFAYADEAWERMGREDILEAFTHHPQIGDRDAIKAKFASTAAWAENEQSGTAVAPEEVLDRLADGNARYREQFGYIFIICATGRRAEEMLEHLERRLANDPATELHVAAEQQAMITRLRLEKLLDDAS